LWRNFFAPGLNEPEPSIVQAEKRNKEKVLDEFVTWDLGAAVLYLLFLKIHVLLLLNTKRLTYIEV
jgi:hypothetical protein